MPTESEAQRAKRLASMHAYRDRLRAGQIKTRHWITREDCDAVLYALAMYLGNEDVRNDPDRYTRCHNLARRLSLEYDHNARR